ncbi:hypothetical protein [Hyphobacterium sp.]|uniref:hypothetical protein n=1 Tax=Hyphobacterium sp. TaxID=2004662 RepID=UPI003BAB6968
MTDIIHQNSSSTKKPVRVSHALALLAGDLACEIAVHWPFPHTGFLERSSPWMHIAGMVIANVIASNRNARVAFDTTYCWKAGAEFADPRFDANNRSVLKSLSLPMWTKRQYRLLSDILECPNSLKVMKHQAVISPRLVTILHALPQPFRVEAIIRHVHNEDDANILARIASADGEKASALLSKLSSASSEKDFWSKASSFFLDRCVQFPIPPQIDDPRIAAIHSIDELRSFGIEMRLCLRNLLGEALSGEQAFYLFNGSEKVVVSISPRIGCNPVIDHMSAQDNNPVPECDRDEIVAVFKKAGIRDESRFVDDWPSELDRRLNRLGYTRGSEPDENLYSKINDLIDVGLRGPDATAISRSDEQHVADGKPASA